MKYAIVTTQQLYPIRFKSYFTRNCYGPNNCIQFALNHILREISTVLREGVNKKNSEKAAFPSLPQDYCGEGIWSSALKMVGKAQRRHGAALQTRSAKWTRKRIWQRRKRISWFGEEGPRIVYVSSDPLICAQFTRSTSSILRINEGMGHQKKSIIVGWVVGWGFWQICLILSDGQYLGSW